MTTKNKVNIKVFKFFKIHDNTKYFFARFQTYLHILVPKFHSGSDHCYMNCIKIIERDEKRLWKSTDFSDQFISISGSKLWGKIWIGRFEYRHLFILNSKFTIVTNPLNQRCPTVFFRDKDNSLNSYPEPSLFSLFRTLTFKC